MSTATPDKVLVGCEHCGAQLRLEAKYQGKKIKCPQCGGIVTVPLVEAPAAPPPAAAAPAAAAPAPAAPAAPAAAVTGARPQRADASASASTSPSAAGAPGTPAVAGARPARGDTRSVAAPEPAAPQQQVAQQQVAGQRPMINRAPTVAQDDPFSKESVTTRSSVAAPIPATIPAGRVAATRVVGRAEAPAGKGRGAKAKGGAKAGSKGANTNLIVGIGGGGVALILILVVVMSSGGSPTTPRNDSGGGTGGNDVSAKSAAERIQEAWASANEQVGDRALSAQMKVLEDFAAERNAAGVGRLFDQYLNEVVGRIFASYGNQSDDARGRINGWIFAAEWAKRLNDEGRVKQFTDEVFKLDPDHVKARELAGWRRWRFSDDDLVQEAVMRGWVRQFDEFQGKWLSPAEFDRVTADFERALKPIRDRMDEWERDPFLQRAYQAEQSLVNDVVLRKFANQFEIRVVRPFVIIFGVEGRAGATQLDARVDAFRGVMDAFWEKWARLVELNGHKSRKREDTIQQPQPFAWLSMATEEGFRKYLEETGEDIGPFTRAFYKPRTECVYFWEGEGRPSHGAIHPYR